MGGWLAWDSMADARENEPENSEDVEDDEDDEEDDDEEEDPPNRDEVLLPLLPPPPKRDETLDWGASAAEGSSTRAGLCWSTGSMNLTTSFSISVAMIGRPSDSTSSFCTNHTIAHVSTTSNTTHDTRHTTHDTHDTRTQVSRRWLAGTRPSSSSGEPGGTLRLHQSQPCVLR